MKQLGVGLAVAILIDATIVRAVLLPATMKLLGERNWWLPKRLGWLPKFEHEPEVTPAAALTSTPMQRAANSAPSRGGYPHPRTPVRPHGRAGDPARLSSVPKKSLSPRRMLPSMQSRNFAARAGRWSAQHRKKAILGWFAFVILATVLGGMVGQKTLADEDTRQRRVQARRPDRRGRRLPRSDRRDRARPGQGRPRGR